MATSAVEQGGAEDVARVARALSATSGSAAELIAAVGGTMQEAEFRRVPFVLPSAEFPRGQVTLDRRAPMGGDPGHWPPESVTLDADTGRVPVPLSALKAVLGAWTRGVPGPDGVDVWNVRFDTPVRPSGGPGRPVTVTAVLSDDPQRSAARVVRVTLFRDE